MSIVHYLKRVFSRPFRSFAQVRLQGHNGRICGSLWSLALPKDASSLCEAQAMVVLGLQSCYLDCPDLHYRLIVRDEITDLERWRFVDFTVFERRDDGTLAFLKFFADLRLEKPKPNVCQEALKFVENLYNSTLRRTAGFDERKFARAFSAEKKNYSTPVQEVAERIVAGSLVCFESAEGRSDKRNRMSFPNFSLAKHPGGGVGTYWIRFDWQLRYFDLWLLVSHVAVDLAHCDPHLRKIRALFGDARPMNLKFGDLSTMTSPPPSDPFPILCEARDFSALTKARAELKARYPKLHIPLSCFFLWPLISSPRFANESLGVVVYIPPIRFHRASVNTVVVKPRRYLNPNAELGGFLRFVKSYKRRLALVRLGIAANNVLSRMFTMLPAKAQHWAHRMFPWVFQQFTGTLTVSIFETVADLCYSAYSELVPRGTLTLFLPIKDKRDQATLNFSLRAPADEFNETLAAIRNAYDDAPALFGSEAKGASRANEHLQEHLA